MWDFDANELRVAFGARVDVAILVVDVAGDIRCEAMTDFAEGTTSLVDIVWIEAISALPCVNLKVIE